MNNPKFYDENNNQFLNNIKFSMLIEQKLRGEGHDVRVDICPVTIMDPESFIPYKPLFVNGKKVTNFYVEEFDDGVAFHGLDFEVAYFDKLVDEIIAKLKENNE